MTDAPATTQSELAWLQRLREVDGPTRERALRTFARQYHWFSLHQVLAFSRIFSVMTPTDRASLADLGSVLFDELGCGSPDRVHSVLFEQFAQAVGEDPAALPIPADEVLPAVRSYIDDLNRHFSSGLLWAAAAYRFLEWSAVASYAPLLAALTEAGLSQGALEFFALHAELELEHLHSAQRLLDRLIIDADDRQSADAVQESLARSWDAMWAALVSHSFELPCGC